MPAGAPLARPVVHRPRARTALFERAVRAALALGATELLIEAGPNAEGFYLHMGARRVGETVSRLTGAERVLPPLRYALQGMVEQHRP